MKDTLFSKLMEYGKSDVYPYHMPGHKRQAMGEFPDVFCNMDITEIEGFDNLHYPEDILLSSQKKASQLYQAEHTFFLINGSTVGVLAAISSALPQKGKLLIARNCHKSVYHAAYLRELELCYLEPKLNEEFDICEPITPLQVKMALEEHKDIAAVMIVSPTYEGRIAKVLEIAEIVHEKQIPLIVDEAHGAHLGFHSKFAKSSVSQGADLIIQSLHKTLPSLTQTALLHHNGDLVDVEKVKKFLRIYQSSSPSYLLMASMDQCITIMEEQGERLLEQLYLRWQQLLSDLEGCRNLKILHENKEEGILQDIGKLIISVKDTNISGVQLYRELLDRYSLQMEMVCDTYVLAMLTVGDTEEGFERIKEALLEIDEEIGKKQEDGKNNISYIAKDNGTIEYHLNTDNKIQKGFTDTSGQNQSIPLSAAFDMEARDCLLEESVGKYAAEFVAVYPPGTPILVPGERITDTILNELQHDLSRNLSIQGIVKKNGSFTIQILDL